MPIIVNAAIIERPASVNWSVARFVSGTAHPRVDSPVVHRPVQAPIPYVHKSRKPLPVRYEAARRRAGEPVRRAARMRACSGAGMPACQPAGAPAQRAQKLSFHQHADRLQPAHGHTSVPARVPAGSRGVR